MKNFKKLLMLAKIGDQKALSEIVEMFDGGKQGPKAAPKRISLAVLASDSAARLPPRIGSQKTSIPRNRSLLIGAQ